MIDPTDRAVARRVAVHALGAIDGEMAELTGGEFSRAYAFTHAHRPLVLRISVTQHAAEGYAKDQYAAERFAATGVPIPRVLVRGQIDGGHYAISERASGRRIAQLEDGARRALLPGLLDTVDAIAAADLSGAIGFGAWDAEGHGTSTTWRSFLEEVIEDRTDGFYAHWHRLFATTFLERAPFERLYRAMLDLAPDGAGARHLIHQDLHFDNLIADQGRVTGVLDWANACYGDPLFDLAWIGWIYAKDYGLNLEDTLRNRYGDRPDYDRRMACYRLRIILDDLRFFARTGREEAYRWSRDRALALLD